VADERAKAGFEKPLFVANDQCRRKQRARQRLRTSLRCD
jgi:hypothetical protein